MYFDPTMITSRQNPTVARAARLEQKKFRDAEGAFLIPGTKLTAEAVAAGVEIEQILVREDAADRVADALAGYDGRVILLGESAFAKISPEKSPDGVICVAKALDKFHKFATIKKESTSAADLCGDDERILLLESLRDPGNLGTVLRSAAAFGCDRVLLSADCAELYNPRTLRAGMGALFKLPTTRVDDLPAAVACLREAGRAVYATALHADAAQLGELALTPRDAFLIGNEGHGLSEAAITASTRAVFIPMRAHTESLNAAAAATVCLWEQARRFGV